LAIPWLSGISGVGVLRAGRNPLFHLRVGWERSNPEETTMSKLIALFAATLLSVTAVAGDKDKKEHQMKSTAATFDSLDKNGDAQLSKTEAAADKSLADSFAAADSNGDGYLSKTEFTARTKS
jgi:hypothetical protein